MSFRLETDQSAPLDGVNRVVIQALSSLIPVGQADPLSRKPLESYVGQMFEAVQAPKIDALSEAVKDMRRATIGSALIAEIYVPAVARRLGEAWVADALDFGAVTIGCARLQGLLWKLEKDWAVPVRSPSNTPPAYLVGVLRGGQHTLGATILAGQLRHRGMSVSLDLELTPDGLLRHVINQQLSGILLSAASRDDLAPLSELVNISRKQNRNTPVIIGGSMMEFSDSIQQQTGADFVTSSVHDVLWYCDARRAAQKDAVVASLEVM